jgi:predicted dienelactone hydrolase
MGLILMIALAGTCAAADETPYKVGTQVLRIVPPEPYDWRGAVTHALITRLWYPADARATPTPQPMGPPGAPVLFEPYVAAEGAPLAGSPAKLPLILLSHGTGGAAEALSWFATVLAAQGYLVAGVEHPGNNALEPYTVQGFALWWERARDLSAVLTALLADQTFGARIDPGRIGAAGHSLGGYTVIELAGGIGTLTQLQAACATAPADANCRPPREFAALTPKATALAQQDPAFAAALAVGAASQRDTRVRAVFPMAPALGPSFAPNSLRAIAIPVAIVAGAADTVAPVETGAKFLAATIPHAALTIFPGAVGHYVFTETCTATGQTAQPVLCADPPGVDRDAIHHAAAAKAIAFFDAALAPRP